MPAHTPADHASEERIASRSSIDHAPNLQAAAPNMPQFTPGGNAGVVERLHEPQQHTMLRQLNHSHGNQGVQRMLRGATIQRSAAPTQQAKAQTKQATPNGLMEEVAAFMGGQMRGNAVGSDVAYMKERLTISGWEGFIPGAPSLGIYQAYSHWYNLVKTGGPWDHKRQIRSAFGQWARDDASRMLFSFDMWSNIHYGYIGLACGFPVSDLIAGAGIAQLKANTSNIPESMQRIFSRIQGPAGMLADFDDPRDQAAIRIGFDLWNSHGASVTNQQLMQAMRNNAGSLNTQRA